MPGNLLATPGGRRWLFAALYLSEGAPIGFLWWALPGLLGELGVDLASITILTSLATLPWVFKFLAAPFLDFSQYKGFGIRRWILACQACMALALLPIAFLDWSEQFALLCAAIACHAVFAAAQDVGIDTLAVRTVPANELGRVNGWMQTGMLLGRAGVAAAATLVFGALENYLIGIAAIIAIIAMPAALLAFGTLEPKAPVERPRIDNIRKALTGKVALAGILVGLLAGAGFEFFGVSLGPRLLERGYTTETLALLYGALAPLGLAAGALLGGAIVDRIGAAASTAAALVLVSGFTGWIGLGQWWPAANEYPLALSATTYFAIGALTASSYALFMQLSQGELAATRISVFMATTNACEAWAAFVGGRLLVLGFGAALLLLTAASLLALAPLRRLAAGPSAEHGDAGPAR